MRHVAAWCPYAICACAICVRDGVGWHLERPLPRADLTNPLAAVAEGAVAFIMIAPRLQWTSPLTACTEWTSQMVFKSLISKRADHSKNIFWTLDMMSVYVAQSIHEHLICIVTQLQVCNRPGCRLIDTRPRGC
jgi:hypothetical protein